jgi:glutamate synthase domain-containing protein 3
MVEIDATNLHYKQLNEKVRALIKDGYTEIVIKNVCGQRYIGAGIKNKNVKITIEGVPGNDLGIFMDGTEIVVKDNVQDGTGNTMNAGRIIVYGNAGDIVGHSMRGGEIFIRGDVGYRVGIHMKEYKDMYPVIVIGGKTKNFLGEYMAGGMIIVLGLTDEKCIGDYVGTGMHGGCIYVRGSLNGVITGKEIKIFDTQDSDIARIMPYIEEFCALFNVDKTDLLKKKFKKIIPVTSRPYGKIYAP